MKKIVDDEVDAKIQVLEEYTKNGKERLNATAGNSSGIIRSNKKNEN